MIMEFDAMEYPSRLRPGETSTATVSKVFLSAVIPYYHDKASEVGHGYDERLIGLNLGIVLPFDDAGEKYEKFTKDFYGDKFDDFVDVVVSGPNSKIQIIVHTGNGWDPAYGSACLFGYLSPLHFAEMPMSKAFGALPMEHGN